MDWLYQLTNLEIIIGILLALNGGAFFLVGLDKRRSGQPAKRRIAEGTLFFAAIMGGSAGVYLGCLAFRHKIRKWYFSLGLPLLLAEQAALLYLIRFYLV